MPDDLADKDLASVLRGLRIHSQPCTIGLVELTSKEACLLLEPTNFKHDSADIGPKLTPLPSGLIVCDVHELHRIHLDAGTRRSKRAPVLHSCQLQLSLLAWTDSMQALDVVWCKSS